MMPRMNPRQMKRMMQQMGIKSTEMEEIEEVIMRGKNNDYIVKDPSVTVMEVQGQQTIQIIGDIETISKGSESAINEEDIELIMEQTGVSEDEAKKELEEANGEPAEAIISIMNKKK